jgi:predicted transport protein
MPIFTIKDSKLTSVKEKRIELEKEIQQITENNLETIFGLKYICSEFQLNKLRIDTLAFDEEVKSFVIIEYKRDRSFSIIDQGFAYLALMLNNKSDFILEFNEKMKNNLKRDDVDWSQTKVLFLANSFTNYQQNAINFRDLPLELWEISKYDNQTILYNRLKSPDSNESIKTVSDKNKMIQKVSKEVKRYSINDHFKKGWENSKIIFETLQERTLEMSDNFEVSPQKFYIGFKIEKSVVFGCDIRKSKIIIGLNRVQPKDLKDPEGKTEYRKNSFKYYNKHITNFEVKSKDDIDYAIFLIKQVYKRFYS